MKVNLSTIGSGYGATAALNANFDAIETAIENTLSRDGTTPNEMEANLDMNDNSILNVDALDVASLTINGTPVQPSTGVTVASAFQSYTFTATAGQTSFSVSPYTPYAASVQVEVNGLSLPPAEISVSGTNVVIPACSVGDEVVIRRYTDAPSPFPVASDISFNQAGTIQTRTVQSKLREVVAVSVTDFGAVGDSNIDAGGGADDTAAINAAIAYCLSSGATLTSPLGKCFRITSAIDMRGVNEIDWRGQIFCHNITSGPAVTFGGHSNGGGRGKYYFNSIHDGGSYLTAPTHALLRVYGLKNSIVEIVNCKYIEIYADEAVPGGTSNAYNTFNLGYCYKLQLKGNGSQSWNTENVFNGGRLAILNIGTTTTEYNHNHNMWTFPTFEGEIQINIQSGSLNRIMNARFEQVDVSGSQITFSSAAFQNWITTQYDTDPFGSQFPYEPIPYTRISDAGQNNLIFKDVHDYFDKVTLFTLDARTPLLVNGTLGDTASYPTTNQRGLFDRSIPAVISECVGLAPGLDWIKFNYSFRDIFTSDFIPVTPGDAFGVEFESDVALMRYAIRCYDANFAPLGAEGAGGAYMAGSSLSYNGSGTYSIPANLSSTDTQSTGAYGFAVRRSEVKYIRITLATGSVTGKLRHATIYFFEKPNRQPRQHTSAVKDFRSMTLPSVPTAGYVRRGTMVSKEDGLSIYICTFAFETTLNGSKTTGATSVTVTSATGVANGDVVGILLDDGSTHWSVVSALAGNTFTVSAFPSGAATGNRVVFNRWATK